MRLCAAFRSGWPLHVGVRLADGFLRAQAEVVGADQISDHELLFRNRGLRLVRLAHTGAGDVWVVGDLPAGAVTAAELDRLLGLLVAAATELDRLLGLLVAAATEVRQRGGSQA